MDCNSTVNYLNVTAQICQPDVALCVYVSLSVKGRHPLAAWRPTAGETVSMLWIGHLYVSYVDRSSFYAKLFCYFNCRLVPAVTNNISCLKLSLEVGVRLGWTVLLG